MFKEVMKDLVRDVHGFLSLPFLPFHHASPPVQLAPSV
jgi:hypothetical protein